MRFLSTLRAGCGILALLSTLPGCASWPSEDFPVIDWVKMVVAPGKLTVCTHLPFAPFEAVIDGRTVGFDVDLVRLLAADVGLELDVVDTEWTQITSGAALRTRRCDLAMGAITITAERRERMTMTAPYLDATQVLLVGSASPYRSLADLSGRSIGVEAGSTGEAFAVGAKRFGLEVIPFSTLTEQLTALRAGLVEAVINDNTVLYGIVHRSTDIRLAGEFNTGERYAFGAATDGAGPQLAHHLDVVLTAARSDGRFGAIHRKWFGTSPS
ncbi:transporter substrate-binding domain-containing protein [Kribbella sp. NPDC056861]|uniref:ABC transporter substrate-binding protein n=1 Tax=Kribbella sp. NPDC056861 TaxID=3154857 RepID=UPI00342EF95F